MIDRTDFNPAPGVFDQVAPGVRRMLAPNPSPMTFRGTNTYVVGQGRVAVIDPGPDDARHLAALEAALAGEVIGHILVTHAHRDHSPLARVLARRHAAPVLAFGGATAGRTPVMQRLARDGLAGGGEGADMPFVPDICLPDGAVIEGDGWRLVAHHTPGHMANHMCFALDDLVFSGDHVMGWSTSMVSPPDGDLGAFLASCIRLRALAPRLLLPGHGAPVTDPAARLEALLAHRLQRTQQVLAALGPVPRPIPSITRSIYHDLAPTLIAAAERNVFAHLIDLVIKNHIHAVPRLAVTSSFRRPPDFRQIPLDAV